MTNRLWFVCAISIVVNAGTAHAQSTMQAEALFREARALMAQKSYPAACAKFEASQKLAPAPTTSFSLAVCRELEGKLATAWGLFLEIERQYRTADDAVAKDLVRNAVERSAKLEARLSKLVIIVPPENRSEGLEVRRDDVVIDPAVWGQALPVDGGTFEITARLPGSDVWTSRTVVRPEGDTQTVTIPKLAVTATMVPETKPAVRAPSRTLPIVLGVSAVVLGGGALGFELWGRSQHDKAQDTLDAGDASRANDLQDSANTKRYVAQALGVAALACAGVSVVLFLRGTGETTPPARAMRITPHTDGEQAGLTLWGRWGAAAP